MKVHVILGGRKGNQIVNDALPEVYAIIKRNWSPIIEVSEREVMGQVLDLAKSTLRDCEIACHLWENGDMLIFTKAYYASPTVANGVERQVSALLA